MSRTSGMSTYLATIAAQVDRHGWVIQGVAGTATIPAFAYTVGLTRLHLPELIVYDLAGHDIGTVTQILNGLAGKSIVTELYPREVHDASTTHGTITVKLVKDRGAHNRNPAVAKRLYPERVIRTLEVQLPPRD